MSKFYRFPCKSCGTEFTAKRNDARFCSGACCERYRRQAVKRREASLRAIVDEILAARGTAA